MSNSCDEITFLLNEPLDGDSEDSDLHRRDRAIGRTACEGLVLPEQPELQFHSLEPTLSDKASIQASGEGALDGSGDRGGNELASSSVTVTGNSASFSLGLVDAYFRQMGDAAWLSREEEIAFAKRIEDLQRAMLAGLCRVPMLVQRIAWWGHEVAEGRLRLADLVDLSAAGSKPGARDVAHGRNTFAAASEDGDPEALANGEAENISGTTACLQTITALAGEIGSLTRKRLAAVARGGDLTKRSRARLHKLLSGLAGEVAALRLHPDRVSDLLAELERAQPTLPAIEQQPSGIAHCAGLPVSDFRNVLAEVAKAQREIKTARDQPASGGFDRAKIPPQEFAGPPRPDSGRHWYSGSASTSGI